MTCNSVIYTIHSYTVSTLSVVILWVSYTKFVLTRLITTSSLYSLTSGGYEIHYTCVTSFTSVSTMDMRYITPVLPASHPYLRCRQINCTTCMFVVYLCTVSHQGTRNFRIVLLLNVIGCARFTLRLVIHQISPVSWPRRLKSTFTSIIYLFNLK